jgi:hypothetical protein
MARTVGLKQGSLIVPWFTIDRPEPDPKACQEPCCRERRGEKAPAGRPWRVRCERCPASLGAPLWLESPGKAPSAMLGHDFYAHPPEP